MTCWIAPADKVQIAGQKLATLPEVSHCYERQTSPGWPYNLFAMIHGQSEEDCLAIAKRISREVGLSEPVMLLRRREFKKRSIKYLA